VPGAGIGSGTSANAICQRPARSPVMRYDLQPAKARLRLKQTQPTFAHQHTAACPVVAADPQPLRSDDPQTLMLAGYTPRRAPMGSCEELPPPLVEVPQPLLLDGLRTAGKPRLRLPGLGQLCGLGVVARCGSLPPRPQQGLLQGEVPHVPGAAALLGQQHLLRGARVQAEPHGTQRSLGHRHLPGTQTPNTRRGRSVVHDLQVHLLFVTRYRPGMFDTQMPNRCEHVMAHVCADFGATLAELNGDVDHVHLLVQYPPKVALSHLVNSLEGCLVQAPAAGLRWPDQQRCDGRPVLVPVILRPVMRWPATVHSQGLHHQPETTRLGKVSSQPARAAFPPQITDDRRQTTLPTLIRLLKAAGFELHMQLAPYDNHEDVLREQEQHRSPEERQAWEDYKGARDRQPGTCAHA
jgi:Transposase IS200 like